MFRREGANVVGLSVVIPGGDLDILWLESQDVKPALIPQQVTRENPVLAVTNFVSKVSGEPRRSG